MKHRYILSVLIFIFVFFCLTLNCYATSKQAVLTDTVNIRKGPGTNYGVIISAPKGTYYTLKQVTTITDQAKNGTCDSGWYLIDYKGTNAYICSTYAQIKDESQLDEYYRPWTTPKLAIVGGARFLSKGYISAGQNTSYLKKFNVNPNSDYSVYNHQYMANLAAPRSEAILSYNGYKENKLLRLPLEFTIPIFNDMPDSTPLPGTTAKTCSSPKGDAAFEKSLTDQGFPESYKCKLRILHKSYPKWTFKSLKTGLNFNTAASREQKVSSIQGEKYYQKVTKNTCGSNKTYNGAYKNGYCQTESGWYVANLNTVKYYLDPRNFLEPEYILMFENLAYSSKYNTTVVQTILNGSFMSGKSVLDKNQTYASIFVEAGKQENVSAVYLASLAIQESSREITRTTSGAEFTYKGVTYKGLYNFFNIGAYSSESNPALAGLVWASGGADAVKVSGSTSNSSSSSPNNEATILKKLGANKKDNKYLVNLKVGTKHDSLKKKLAGYTVTTNAKSNAVIKTGDTITIKDGNKSYKYTIVVSGDVDGDGKLGATDYVKIKNYIMDKGKLNDVQNIAADVDNNGSISATDYVKIKNSIMKG